MLDIGLEVKILRERLKMSAKDLAERVGLSQSQMSRLEKGQRRIDTRMLARIAGVLGVDPSYFFRGEAAPVREVVPPRDPGGLGKAVRSERRKRHLAAEDLAGRAGTTKATILSIEEGKRELDPRLAERIAKVLRLSPGYFLELQQERIRNLESQVVRLEQALGEQGRGAAIAFGDRELRAVPVLGTVAGGYPRTFDAAGEPAGEPEDFVYLPDLGEGRAFALHVVGDSMESPSPPSFAEGDLVVFAGGAAHLRSRNFAFVRLREAEPVFRQVFFESSSRVRLQPLNLSHAPETRRMDDVLGMWRLISHVRRY